MVDLMPFAQIARTLGLTHKQVTKGYERAMRKMRQELESTGINQDTFEQLITERLVNQSTTPSLPNLDDQEG